MSGLLSVFCTPPCVGVSSVLGRLPWLLQSQIKIKIQKLIGPFDASFSLGHDVPATSVQLRSSERLQTVNRFSPLIVLVLDLPQSSSSTAPFEPCPHCGVTVPDLLPNGERAAPN